MEMSYCQELDVQGMQPHSREFLEYQVIRQRSHDKAMKLPGIIRDEKQYDNKDHMDGWAHWGQKSGVSEEGEQFGPKP